MCESIPVALQEQATATQPPEIRVVASEFGPFGQVKGAPGEVRELIAQGDLPEISSC